MVSKIKISQLTKKAKDEYFAALLSLKSLHECISSLKKDLLNKENDIQTLLNKLKIFIENGTVVFRYLGYADTTILEVN
jgi:uncharacterized protein YerC